ncbi:MAG TPA: hypothetical protein PKZ46_05815, partial [Candidatus Cloacimonadota bacterium]|nr:hypothetical protein [Candidatus Cloacimonadota bacterium]
MQNKLNKMFLMLILTLLAVSSWAAVSEYTFTSSLGSYTEITGGTQLQFPDPYVNNPVFLAIPIGFDFVYDGITYSTVSISENAFLAMGNEVVTANLPISATDGTNNAI